MAKIPEDIMRKAIDRRKMRARRKHQEESVRNYQAGKYGEMGTSKAIERLQSNTGGSGAEIAARRAFDGRVVRRHEQYLPGDDKPNREDDLALWPKKKSARIKAKSRPMP